jgi:hypothetical protein
MLEIETRMRYGGKGFGGTDVSARGGNSVNMTDDRRKRSCTRISDGYNTRLSSFKYQRMQSFLIGWTEWLWVVLKAGRIKIAVGFWVCPRALDTG